MRVAVVGTRTMTNADYLAMILENYLAVWGPFVLVSGGARGADTLAARWARSEGLEVKIWPAEWDRLGKKAGFVRNKQIVDDSDCVIAFWDGRSRGTKATIDLAMAAGKPYWVHADDL